MENNEPKVNNQTNTQVNEPSKVASNNMKQLVSAIIVAGVLIAGAVLLRGSERPIKVTNIQNEASNNTPNTQIRKVTSDDHIVGSKNAKIVIVEYSDTECPFCKVFHKTMQDIVAQNNGQVAWVYRHYPIAQLHQKAFREAEATECAWEQGGNDSFWKYTNEIYKRTLSNDQLPTEELPKIAQDTGLDLDKFNTCLDSGKFADKINRDLMDGQANGVQGTPTSFILMNGKVVDKIEGAQSFSTVQQQINNLLK